ncbi:MAG: glycosyltransferase family 39 protein [Chloroflexi bacterium]|nr:glycosyltransferase family 39 protein [Chloroflexota bacterium]
MAVFLWLMLFRQTLYPHPWFDEGLNISTAAMLARDGVYALPDSAGLRLIDPAIQTGPTVLGATALIFKLFGTGLLQARLVMLPFTALAIVSIALLARRLGGNKAAALAVLLLLVGSQEPYLSFVFMARQVLGEVPAIGFYLLALLLWLWAVAQPKRHWLALALSGLAWGVAMITKSQVMLLTPVCLGALALLDGLYYRRAGWLAFILPGAVAVSCVAGWYAFQIAVLGLEQFQENSRVLREGFLLHIVGLNPAHWLNAAHSVWRSGFWLWGLPGLLWGMAQARQRTALGFAHAAALALPIVGFIWFALFSVGWSRYAFYTAALAPIWVAGLAVDFLRGGLLSHRRLNKPLLLTIALGLYIAFHGWPMAKELLAPNDIGYEDMRRYLATQVPADAVIESWEWEFSLDARQPIHHPTTPVTNAYTNYLMSGHPRPVGLYDYQQANPDYILSGPFAQWTGIYDPELKDARLVARFGLYYLYQPRPSNAR